MLCFSCGDDVTGHLLSGLEGIRLGRSQGDWERQLESESLQCHAFRLVKLELLVSQEQCVRAYICACIHTKKCVYVYACIHTC